MIRRAPALAVLAVMMLGLAWLSAPTTRADATIESTSIQNDYPKSLTFKMTASAPADITDVVLDYRITGRGTSALGTPQQLTPAKTLTAEVLIQVNSGSSYIPVGSEFVYSWRVTTADGATVTSPEQKFLFLPTGQNWENVAGDFMTVYYHGDKKALAEQYLQAGVETYEKIGKSLFNIQLAQVPVKVILFDNEKESDLARPGAGQGTFDAAVTTCGTKVTNDIVLVIPVSCGTKDPTDTLRHEFGHILNQTAGEGPLGKLTSWLDEGTAVYAQTEPGNNYVSAFQTAARANRLLDFATMGTAPADSTKVNLFYGQSYMMVRYLIDKGGPAQYSQFFATIKKGSRFDEALKSVYGFDLAGFQQEFVAASGGTAQPTVAPTKAPQQQTSPTAAPTKRPASQASPTAKPTTAPARTTSNSNDDGIDNVALGIIGVAVLFALLGVFSFLVATMLGNNRKRTVAGPGPSQPYAPPPPNPVNFEDRDKPKPE